MGQQVHFDLHCAAVLGLRDAVLLLIVLPPDTISCQQHVSADRSATLASALNASHEPFMSACKSECCKPSRCSCEVQGRG